MYIPWRNKSDLSKAIAIVATVGVLAFGLCSANVLVQNANTERWQRVQDLAVSACSVTMILSILVLIGLLTVKALGKSGRRGS